MHGAARVFELLEEDWNHLTALQIKTVLDSSAPVELASHAGGV